MKGQSPNNEPTPWAVSCPNHGQIFLTQMEYDRQMDDKNIGWICPCGQLADFDRDNWEDERWKGAI